MNIMNLRRLVILVLTGLFLQSLFDFGELSRAAKAQANTADAEALRAMVEADWAAQERGRNRTIDEPSAVRDAYKCAEELLSDLRKMPAKPDVTSQAVTLECLRSQVNTVDSLDKKARLVLYHRIRSTTRNLALKNPLIASRPIVFMKRRRFI